MHRCASCQAVLPPEAVFCPACGAPAPVRWEQLSPHHQHMPPTLEVPPPPPPLESFPQPGVLTDIPVRQGTATPTYARQQQGNRSSAALIVLLAVVIILSGSGLIAYLGMIRPTIEHTHATATAQRATALANAHATNTALAHANATATMQALDKNPQGLYSFVTGQQPKVTDPLSSNSSSSDWDEENNPDGSACSFKSGGYHVITSGKQNSWLCIAKGSNYSDFAIQVQMSVVKGLAGGIVFRYNSLTERFYFLFVTEDGRYSLNVFDGSSQKPLAQGRSQALQAGLNQQNTLAVIARGSTINIYINKQSVTSVQDNTSNGGQVALLGASRQGQSGDVSYSNAQFWDLAI